MRKTQEIMLLQFQVLPLDMTSKGHAKTKAECIWLNEISCRVVLTYVDLAAFITPNPRDFNNALHPSPTSPAEFKKRLPSIRCNTLAEMCKHL